MSKLGYNLQHPDELQRYLWLKPEVTGLAVDVFVDDSAAYVRDGHPLLAFVRNGYRSSDDKFIAIAVEDGQELLSADFFIEILERDALAVRQFLKENQKLLRELADGKIAQQEFAEQMRMFRLESIADEFGGIYADGGKRLLKCPDVRRYRIAEGCKRIDCGAFMDCDSLEILYLPYTFSKRMVDFTFENMPVAIEHFCAWDRPYVEEVFDVNEYWVDEDETETDEYGVVYANEGQRLIQMTNPNLIGGEYRVPDGVLTICDGAFMFCHDYLELSLLRSIKVIGDYIFGKEGGKIIIRD